MASIQKRGETYRVQVSVKGVRKSATFRTKSEAQQWAAEEELKIRKLAKGETLDIPLSEVIKRYQLEISPQKKTWIQEVKRLDILLKEPMANRYIRDVRREDVENWIASQLERGLKNSSVLRYLTVLSNVFTVAMHRWGYLDKSPMLGVIYPKAAKPRTQRFSDEEIAQLLVASGYPQLHRPRARVGAAMLFAIETAMRAGEICGLTWEHVHFERRIAHLPMTKNGSARDVPLSKEAIRILRELEAVKSEKDARVFQIKTDSLSGLFLEMKKGVGLSHLHFHDTRREALSRLAKKIDVMTLAKISGHKDVKILLNTYYAPNMEEIASLLD